MNTSDIGTTCADALVERMLSLGIRAIFGVPGAAIEPMYDAIARAIRRGAKLRLVTARNECGAAYMAQGWWRETGQCAAVVTTTGPGAVNASAGVACAMAEAFPLLCITAQAATGKHGRLALQESSSAAAVDTVAMYAAFTKFSALVSSPQQLPAMMAIAVARMHDGLTGPVHLSFPTDVLQSRFPDDDRVPSYVELTRREPPKPAHEAVKLAAETLSASQRPVIALGEASRANVETAFALAERLDAAVVASPYVNDRINGVRNRLFRGYCGFAGHASAAAALDEADVILAVNASGGEFEGIAWGPHARRLVHVADHPEQLSRTPEAVVQVVGNVSAALAQINRYLTQRPKTRMAVEWLEPSPSAPDQPVHPADMMAVLVEALPQNAAIYLDAGNALAWAIRYLHGSRLCGGFRLSQNYGSTAWSIGTGVGAALSGKLPTVILAGDGAMLMAGQEFSVAVQERAPVLFIVLNDASLGMVRHGQRLANVERVAVELPLTDFAAMANAMGGNGILIERTSELRALSLDRLFSLERPTLLDVRIDREAVPPIADRIRRLTQSRVAAATNEEER